MSVLVKGMEMPKCCAECWAEENYGDYPVCLITGEQVGYLFKRREERMDNCPLVPVPPHGRLIDADALTRAQGFHDYKYVNGLVYVSVCEVVGLINNAPTIIPPDRKEEEV